MSDKQTTLKLLDEEYQSFRQLIDGLEGAALTRVWFGSWSVKDIVAHVLGWQREMTEALRRMARGEKPTPEGVDYSNTDEWNAKFAAAMQGIDARTVIAAWQQTHMTFARAAQAVPDDRYGEGKTVNRLIEASGWGHYREHAPAIRDWRQKKGL